MTEITVKELKALYSIGFLVGKGKCSVLRKCKRRSDMKVFILKTKKKKDMDEDQKIMVEAEINTLRTLSHPNIIKLEHYCYTSIEIHLILEYCEGDDLFMKIIDYPLDTVGKGRHFHDKHARMTFYEICTALDYMHSKSIVHRHIIPEGIYFSSKSFHEGIKVSKFCLAGSCKDAPCTTPCGVPNYVAPEIISRKPYGTQADMWSLGVVLYVLLCGFPPFYDKDDNLSKLYVQIKGAKYDMPSPYWDGVSEGAKDVVRKLLQPDPAKRLTAKMALVHPWVFRKEKLTGLISGYIGHGKYDILSTVSAEVILNFAVYLFADSL